MAVIQKIRERYAKWAGGIIALALVGFVLQDAFSSNSNIGKLFGGDPNSVATVNGSKIERIEFDKRVQDYQSLSEMFRKGQQLTDEEQAGLRQQVLDQLVIEHLMKNDADKLGLNVTDAERKELIYGQDPDGAVKQFMTTVFNTQPDQFQPQMVKQFEKEAPKQRDQPQVEKILKQWESMKDYVVSSRLLQKYNALITNSVYTPKFVIDRSTAAAHTFAGVRYVKIPYTSINDKEVPVSEADINAYMEKHRPLFEVDQPSRSIDYVVFNVNPDAADTGNALGALQGLKSGFATASNTEEYVNRNSEQRFDGAFVTKATFKSQFADSILSQPTGTVYGPYFEGGMYKLSKITERTTMPDSVKCRHILIKFADQGKQLIDSNIAKARIDSVEKAIQGGADFKAVAASVSEDPGSKANGGEYEFSLSQRNGLSKEFADFIFDGKTGEKKVVHVNNGSYAGYHYIEILSQKNPQSAVKLATIAKSLTTGSVAYNNTNAKANEFAGKNATAAAFDETAKKENLNKRQAEDLKPSDFVIQGLGSAREIIRWAWEAKLGEVSSPIQVGNDKVVVAKVSAVQEAGLRKPTAQMKAQLEAMVRAEKKAKMLIGKYKGATLEAIAQAAGQPVDVTDSVTANASFTQKLGYEPRVIGYIFNPKFAVNSISPALQGRDGVFFVQLVHRDAAPVAGAGGPADMMLIQQRRMDDQQAKSYVGRAFVDALKKSGKVTYRPKNI